MSSEQVAASDKTPSAPAAIYTASDFARLPEGVDPGLVGEVHVYVWAPPGDEWRLSNEKGTFTLTLSVTQRDPEPRWQALGKISLVKGQLLKVAAAKDRPNDETAASKTAKGKAKEKPPTPVPALLLLSSRADANKERLLELIRGRTDAVDASGDTRRTHVRTNWQGAEFQRTATAQAWRDRAAHRPRADARCTRALADVSQNSA